jgi:hypothetical protein
MANIPGATNALPGVFTDVITQSSGVAIPGGSRVVAMIGQGSTNETLVAQALGGGQDGLDPTFTTNVGSDGRHFALANFPVISNRTTIFKNGIPLTGLELGPITSTTTFSFLYDYQLDPTTGHLLLQAAHLQDQGGSFYTPLTTNVGLGSINGLTLVNPDAPPEVWTVRCVAVQRNALNQPIAGTATFLAFGSVSGAKLDANGNPIVWIANGQTVSNGVLQFSITETQVSSVTVSPFVPGDGFTVIVSSGVLVRGDSLTTNEIPLANINNPTLLQGITDLVNFSGLPSLSNNLSLGGQLLFSNGASSMIGLQAAPPLPRRTSYVLDPSVNALSTDCDDFVFPFPLGVVPDINSDVHVFVTNPVTLVETQLLPNKFPYYTLNAAGQPTTCQFVLSNLQPPAGYSFDYTVVNSFETVVTGFDGYLGRVPAVGTFGTFSSPSVLFDSTYPGKLLKIIDSNNKANIGIFNITAVSSGHLSIQTITVGEPGDPSPPTTPSGFPDFVSQTPVAFELVRISTGLPVPAGEGTDGTLVALLNTATGTFTSTAVNFGHVDSPANLVADYRLQINGSAVGNNGLYDIIGYSSLTNTLTLQMAFVSESNLRYEVIDPTLQSTYLVLNKNVVPNGNQLRVTIVDQRDATFFDAGWLNALQVLETVECDILVPLPNQTITVIFQNCLSHCITQSNISNKHERVLFIGAIQGLTPANLTGQTPAAVENIGILEGIQGASITDVLNGNVEDLANYSVSAAYGETFRCVYFYPDQIVVQAGSENVLIDGFYIAAAAAGFANADLNLANPFTNKVFSGFTILRNKTFSTLVLEQLAQAGVCTLQPVAGGGRVVWGITTSQSGFPEEQEISIVFIRDRVAKILRAGFQGFIGSPQTPNTGAALNTEAVILLNSMISQGLITAFKGLTVVQDSVDPRQWDIAVSVQPVYPLNWIYIKVTVANLGA